MIFTIIHRNVPYARLRLPMLALLALLLTACSGGDAPKSSLEIATRGLYAAELSQDGNLALAASIYHGGSYWNVAKNQRLFSWNHKKDGYSNIVAAAISKNGNYVATADERTIALWNANTGENISFWTAPGDILDIELTADADFAILGLADHTAVIFDIKRGGVLRTFVHNDRVGSIAMAENSRLLLTGSDDFSVRLWKINSGELLHTWKLENQVNVTALSANGKFAFAASQADRSIIMDTASGRIISELPIDKYPYTAGASYTAARFSDDGSILLTGATNRMVQQWNSQNARETGRWQGNKKDRWKPTNPSIMAVAFKGKAPVAIGSNGLVYFF